MIVRWVSFEASDCDIHSGLNGTNCTNQLAAGCVLRVHEYHSEGSCMTSAECPARLHCWILGQQALQACRIAISDDLGYFLGIGLNVILYIPSCFKVISTSWPSQK